MVACKEREIPEASGGLPGWDQPLVDRLIWAAVKIKLPLFEHFGDIGKDDLYQESMIRAREVHPKWSVARGAYSTWITRCVNFRMRDLFRGRMRHWHRDQAVAENNRDCVEINPTALAEIRDWYESGASAGLPGGAGGDDETLEDWVRSVYRFAQNVFPARRPGQRDGHLWTTPAQMVTLALVMRKRNLSLRGARELIANDKDIRKAMKLSFVPVHSTFWEAKRMADRYLAA